MLTLSFLFKDFIECFRSPTTVMLTEARYFEAVVVHLDLDCLKTPIHLEGVFKAMNPDSHFTFGSYSVMVMENKQQLGVERCRFHRDSHHEGRA